MRISLALSREKTAASSKKEVVFTAPGVYQPPYGKASFLMQGQGQPGNSPDPSSYAGTNPPTGGNYAGTNPSNQPWTYWSAYEITRNNANGTYSGASMTYGSSSSLPSPGGYTSGYTYISTNYSAVSVSPGVAGNAYYNPYVAGTDYYNPYTPGTAGTPSTVLGVSLPGGAVGTAAPVIGYVPVAVGYTNAGVPISVPPGGYVKVKNI